MLFASLIRWNNNARILVDIYLVKVFIGKLLMKKSMLFVALLVFFNPLHAQSQANNITGLNDFAFKIYQQAATETNDNNFAISPFGISSLLNIVYLGTNGSTKQEIAKALGYTSQNNNKLDISRLTKSFINSPPCTNVLTCNKITQYFKPTSQFNCGNALWMQSGIQLNPDFAQKFDKLNAGKYYYVDYVNKPNDAADQINTWVANLTNNYIKQLITSDLIGKQTRMIATNVIYFKGLWQTAFKPSATQLGKFTLNDGKIIQVPMMSANDSFSYAENPSMKILILPYKDSSLAMAIILPRQGQFDQFVKSLNFDKVMNVINNSSKSEINIKVPKFILQSTFNNLSNNLMNVGVKQLFTPAADFSIMTKSPLYVSNVIQKVYVAVDEQGTIAAAATGMVIFGSAMVIPKIFNADHPFVFLIYDTKSNLILFMGNVMNPLQ